MNAIRKIVEVKEDNIVTLKLPENVKSKKVEVIIILVETEEIPKPSKESSLTDLQKLLLAAPDMSDEEYNLIMEKRKALNEWN